MKGQLRKILAKLAANPAELAKHAPQLCRAATIGSVVELRAGGAAIAETTRDELLAKSLAGGHVELEVELLAYEQRAGESNRNFVRFRDGLMVRLGQSGRGAPFLRDHNQHDSLAKAGVITASATEKRGEGDYAIRQTVVLKAPWAVQMALHGLMDSVSIGWNPTGPVMCSSCNAPIFARCYHFPGDRLAEVDAEGGGKRKVRQADGPIVVEWIFTDAELVETSAVNVPGVPGARVDDVRASFAASLAAGNPDLRAVLASGGDFLRGDEIPEETHEMDPKLLELLGLPPTASAAEVTAAAAARLNAAAADKAALAIVQGDLAGFKTQLDALQAGQRKRDEDTFILDALSSGRIAKGDEEHWRELYRANAPRAGELMAKREAGSVTPVGTPPQRESEPGDDAPEGGDGGGELGVRQLTITGGDIPGGLYLVPERSREERRQLARAVASAVKLVETHPNPAARWWAERCGFDGRLRGPTSARLSATAIANDADLAASRVGFTAAFMQALEQAKVDPLEMFYTTVPTSTPDQVINWMGDLPGFEEWDGDRKLAGLEAFKLSLNSKKWANGIRIKNDDIKFDRLGLLPQQINGLAGKGRRHRYDRMMQMLVNGFDGAVFPLVSTGLAYDGAFFFSDSHATGDNKLTVALDAAGLAAAELLLESQTTYDGNDPLEIHGTTLAVGPKLRVTAEKLLTQERLANGEDNYHRGKYKLLVSNRIRSTWDDYWFLADLSHEIKPFGFQLVEEISTSAVIGQGQNNSVPAFINDELWFGAQAHYNMFYFEFRTIAGSQV